MEGAFKVCLCCATLPPFLSWPFTCTRSWRRRWWWVLRIGKITSGSLPDAMQKALPASPTIPPVVAYPLWCLWSVWLWKWRWEILHHWRDSIELIFVRHHRKVSWGPNPPKHLQTWVIFAATLWVKDKKQDFITVLISFLLLAVNVYHVAQCTLSARRENKIKQRKVLLMSLQSE